MKYEEVVRALFKTCPFCGEEPNIFKVLDKRYDKKGEMNWIVECKNMGCIFKRSSPNVSLENLMHEWNKRES